MADEQPIKQIPYGVSDFERIRQSNYYYVDKTRYIRDIEEKSRYLFFIRPRRFGKSLLLSTLECYYDIAWKDRFDFLFQGTDIHQNPTQEKNSYMILKLNFSKVSSNIEKVEESFLVTLIEETVYFINKYEPFLDVDKKAVISRIYSMKNAATVLNTLLTLCKGKEHRLYVIIDEYDNFANTILSEAGELEFEKITHGSGFFREFFNTLKAGTSDSGAPISKLFMTGVSPITLDDVTSGFNIADNMSLDLDIHDILGFTQPEVETMIEYYRQTGKIHHSTPELMEIMSRWYDHYRFSVHSTKDVFNSFLVLYFIKEYLKVSNIPGDMLDRNALIDYGKLRKLIIIDKESERKTNGNFLKLQHIMEHGNIHSQVEKGFSIANLSHSRNFISLLYYFGLLTFRGLDEEDTPILAIPNETIKRLFYDYISETLEETGDITLKMDKYAELVNDMAYKGEWRPLIEYIADQMKEGLGLRDLITGEKAHQVFWNVYLGLSKIYSVYSEKEMNQGYCDLVMIPQLAQNPRIKYSYLLELKYIKPSEYEKEDGETKVQVLRQEAEAQLKQYCRDDKFQNTIGKTTLKKLILVFSGHLLAHHSEI